MFFEQSVKYVEPQRHQVLKKLLRSGVLVREVKNNPAF